MAGAGSAQMAFGMPIKSGDIVVLPKRRGGYSPLEYLRACERQGVDLCDYDKALLQRLNCGGQP